MVRLKALFCAKCFVFMVTHHLSLLFNFACYKCTFHASFLLPNVVSM